MRVDVSIEANRARTNLGALPLGLACLLGVFLAPGSEAQAQLQYIASQFSTPYVPLVGGTSIPFSSPDDDTRLIPIGFTFVFYNEPYTHLNVGTNGAISFARPCVTDAVCGFSACASPQNVCEAFVPTGGPSFSLPVFPNSDTPDAVVAAFWDDLHLSGGGVTYRVLGAAPSRELVIQWNVRHFAGAVSRAQFQIRLDEASGAVRLAYGPLTPGPDTQAWSGAMGIENADGTQGLAGLPCANTSVGCVWSDLVALENQVIQFLGPTGPELMISGEVATGAEAGTPLQLSVTARNLGPQATNIPVAADIYFSPDQNIAQTDTLLGSVVFPAIPARGSATATISAQVPNVAPGYYSIGGIIDPANLVMEDVETDNIGVFRSNFLVGADLGVEVDTARDSGPGEQVTLIARVRNYGSAQPSVGVAFYFSRDQILDASDVLLGASTLAVPAQPTTALAVPVTIPALVPGRYYTIAVVDPEAVIVEADERNNTAVSPGLSTLQGPDLEVESVFGASAFAFRGQTFEVTFTLQNDGLAAANGFSCAVFISENTLISTISDPMVGEFGPFDLPAGGSMTVTRTVSIPASIALRNYYLGVIADHTNVVLEERRNNNIGRQQSTIEVRDPAPDLLVSNAQGPVLAAAGESLVIERTLVNAGNASAAFEYDVYLSADDVLDPGTDFRIGTAMRSLAAASDEQAVDVLRIPSSVVGGTYRVGYVVDPRSLVLELYEDNNHSISETTVAVLSAPLRILTPQLPLATLGVVYDVVIAAEGGSGSYEWSVARGRLPPGIALDANSGRLFGTPVGEGAFEFTVRVSDGSLEAARDFRLVAASQSVALQVVTRSVPPAFAGRPYLQALTAIGGVAPYRWALTGASRLPSGMTLEPDGTLTGTPGVTSVVNLNVRVTDALGAFSERPLIFRVVEATDAVRIETNALADARLGSPYNEALEVVAGTGRAPFTFVVAGGSLPPGLLLENDDNGARVTGTPTHVGVFDFTLRVVDGVGDFDVNRYVVHVDEADGVTFVSISEDLPRGEVGKVYLDENGAAVRLKAVSSTSTSAMTFGIRSGELPAGLELSPSGVISGTPSGVGVFTFVAVAVDGVGQTEARALSIVIAEQASMPEPEPQAREGCGCSAADSAQGGFGGIWVMAGLCALGVLRRRRGRALSLSAFGAFLFLMSSAPRSALAQNPLYQVSSYSQPYQVRSGGSRLNFGNSDDDEILIALPFTVRFFSTDYTELRIGTNGLVSFGSSALYYMNAALPETIINQPLIALWWDDLTTQYVETFIEGSAPNRVFIVQYSVSGRLGSITGGQPQMQLHLFEADNARFELHYGPMANMTASSVWSSSVGFQDETGSTGFNLLNCNPSCSGADFTALTNTVVRATQDTRPDIVAARIVAPLEVFQGVPFEVEAQLRSTHGQPVGPLRYDVHAIAEGTGAPMLRIFRSAPLTLAPLQTLTVTATPTLPLSAVAGRYRLVLTADSTNVVDESDELNNGLTSAGLSRLAPRRADFVIAEVSSPRIDAAPGEAVPVQLRVRNRGNLDGAAHWRLVLSVNQAISIDDLALAEGEVELPLLSTATISANVALPASLAAGSYWIGALVDADNLVSEISETNNTGRSSTALEVMRDELSVSTAALPGAYEGVDYSVFLRARGGNGRYSWSLTNGSLPMGLSLNPTSGELRGRPQRAGDATFTITVASGGLEATRALTLSVAVLDGGLTIVTRELLPGQVGAPYPPASDGTPREAQQRIVTLGGDGPVSLRLLSAAPGGLSLAQDGYLSGVPTQRGRFELRVEATDGTATATRALSLLITEPGRLSLVPSPLPEATVGEPYSFQLRATGASRTATVTFSASTLPQGMTLGTTGVLAGVPQQLGTFVFEVKATEGTGASAPEDAASFRLVVVSDVGLGIAPSSLPVAELGKPYEAYLDARGGEAPLTWRVAGDAMPRGLRFEIDRNSGKERLRFIGTPEEQKLASLLVTVRDARGRSVEVGVSLLVQAPIRPDAPAIARNEGCSCSAEQSETGLESLAVLALLAIGLLGCRRRA